MLSEPGDGGGATFYGLNPAGNAPAIALEEAPISPYLLFRRDSVGIRRTTGQHMNPKQRGWNMSTRLNAAAPKQPPRRSDLGRAMHASEVKRTPRKVKPRSTASTNGHAKSPPTQAPPTPPSGAGSGSGSGSGRNGATPVATAAPASPSSRSPSAEETAAAAAVAVARHSLAGNPPASPPKPPPRQPVSTLERLAAPKFPRKSVCDTVFQTAKEELVLDDDAYASAGDGPADASTAADATPPQAPSTASPPSSLKRVPLDAPVPVPALALRSRERTSSAPDPGATAPSAVNVRLVKAKERRASLASIALQSGDTSPRLGGVAPLDSGPADSELPSAAVPDAWKWGLRGSFYSQRHLHSPSSQRSAGASSGDGGESLPGTPESGGASKPRRRRRRHTIAAGSPAALPAGASARLHGMLQAPGGKPFSPRGSTPPVHSRVRESPSPTAVLADPMAPSSSADTRYMESLRR